jgi:hypothetical protein
VLIKFSNVVLEEDEEYQLDRSCEKYYKWQGGEEYPTDHKKKED